MAQCKDCDKCFHRDVCAGDTDRWNYFGECPHYINSADVAPKSEITRLQSQVNRLKQYDEERDIKLHARLIANTKSEVAEQIFEDLELLMKIYTFPVVKLGVIEIVKEPFWCIEPDDFTTIKKKYTETKESEN